MSLPASPAVVAAIERRVHTDRRPRYFVHVVLPLLITVAGAVGAYAYASSQGPLPAGLLADRAVFDAWRADEPTTALIAIAILAVTSVGAEVLFYLGAYRLMQRGNDHVARDRELREGIIEVARADAGGRASADQAAHVAAMEKVHAEAAEDEKPRKATLHLIVTVLVNPWVLFMLYRVLKDMPRHARRQAHFARHAAAVLGTSRFVKIPEMKPIPERSFLLFVGLAVVLPIAMVAGAAFLAADYVLYAGAAAGLLLLALHFVWWSFAYYDPVHHFEAQAAFEDALLPAVRGDGASETTTTAPSATPAPRAAAPAQAAMPAASVARPTGPLAPATSTPRPAGAPATTPAAPATQPAASVIWACPKCGKKYKVPPKRPVKVTCKACGHAEILRA